MIASKHSEQHKTSQIPYTCAHPWPSKADSDSDTNTNTHMLHFFRSCFGDNCKAERSVPSVSESLLLDACCTREQLRQTDVCFLICVT